MAEAQHDSQGGAQNLYGAAFIDGNSGNWTNAPNKSDAASINVDGTYWHQGQDD